MPRGMRKGPIKYKPLKLPEHARFRLKIFGYREDKASQILARKRFINKLERQRKITSNEAKKLLRYSQQMNLDRFNFHLNAAGIRNHLQRILTRQEINSIREYSRVDRVALCAAILGKLSYKEAHIVPTQTIQRVSAFFQEQAKKDNVKDIFEEYKPALMQAFLQLR